jgi:hypothetical protein
MSREPFLQVQLGAHNDTRDVLEPAEIHNFVVNDLDHVERALGRNGVDQDIAMDPNGVFCVEY